MQTQFADLKRHVISWLLWVSGETRTTSKLSLMKSYGRAEVPTLDPSQVLEVGWRTLAADELARYLRRVLVAERKCIVGEFPRSFRPRFKWRRLAVARRLQSLGGVVSPRVFVQPNARSWSSGERPPPNVPLKYSWPGVFTLVPLSTSRDEG